MRKQFTLLLLLLLCAVWAGAQGREVNGKVTDSAGNAVSAATIRIKGFKKGVSATSDGSFKINVPPNSLRNGFASADDQALFAAYSNNSGSENPWFENVDPTAGPTVLASTFVNFLAGNTDPRLPTMAKKGSGGNYLGRVIGTNPAPDYKVYSNVNSFYAGASAPQALLNYSEALFLKAEAIFRTSGAAAATPVYINAINSHMSALGLDTGSAPVLAYLAVRGSLTAANGIQRIMEEKDIANFLSIENFTDWRRTGFPALTIVQNPYVPAIPRRFPYPLAELTSNPQPQQNANITDRVWWDAQ